MQPSLPPTILLPSKTPKILNIPFLQSVFPISTNCHPPIISYGAFKSNLFLKVMIFITSLMALILHHHPSSPSLVLHPQIQHTQPGSVRIISFLAFSLVLSPFHYNHLLPAPPLPLMHGKPWSSFKFLVIQEIAYSCSVIHRDWVSISCRYYFRNQLICSILTELGVTLPTPPVIYCDNVGAIYLCCLSFATWNM